MAQKEARKQFRRQKLLNRFAEPGPFDCILVLDNLKHKFNIGKIFRSADALGAREVHLVGTDYFDPAPAKGSFKWVPARFFDTFGDCYIELVERGFHLFVLEPDNDDLLHRQELPARSAFIFGHEEFGISFDKNSYPAIETLRIAQFGKVQSLNVSIAASLVLYEYMRQHGSDRMPSSAPACR